MADFYELHDPETNTMKRKVKIWHPPTPDNPGMGTYTYTMIDAPPLPPRPPASDDGMSFMGWVGIVILVGVLLWAITTPSGGEPGRCVQEDSFMGENVVTCEPVE